ncbi:MAG: acyltransferase, partial [Muribaculaceae bacterium]|nr:acyltransferase [Muribaculaceae bacterium]
IGKPINNELEKTDPSLDKVEVVRRACSIIDREIHLGYEIYPLNYIAFDTLSGGNDFASHYTAAEVDDFNRYLDRQLDKVDLDNITDDERQYMRQIILNMYANPLRNKLNAQGHEA